MRKFILLMLVISALILSACGGGDKPTPTPEAAAAAPQAAESAPAGDAAKGQQIYNQACIACHGPTAEGITGLGKNLKTSEFISQKNDGELFEFIKVGRDAGDPLNTTGVAMPPKGGNPAMSEQEIADIVAYLRTIHQ